MKYDKELYDFMGNVKKGMAVMPDFKEQTNRQSLWTYYETLPVWAREN